MKSNRSLFNFHLIQPPLKQIHFLTDQNIDVMSQKKFQVKNTKPINDIVLLLKQVYSNGQYICNYM